jgi:hypothetical protein
MAISMKYTGDTYDNSITYIADAVAAIGVTTDEATEAISKLAQLMKDMQCANARIAWLEDRISQLGSVPDAKTENPNQKSDLEIFNRIVPSEEFLKLEGNMFLD